MGGSGKQNSSDGTCVGATAVTGKNILALMEAQGCREGQLRCALTGRILTPETVGLDHIVPRSRGGTDTLDNLQFVSKEANQAKATMLQEDFIQLCRDVVKTHGAAEIT